MSMLLCGPRMTKMEVLAATKLTAADDTELIIHLEKM